MYLVRACSSDPFRAIAGRRGGAAAEQLPATDLRWRRISAAIANALAIADAWPFAYTRAITYAWPFADAAASTSVIGLWYGDEQY